MAGTDEEVVRRFYEEFWNRWDFALASFLIARGARFLAAETITARNRDEYLAYVRNVRSGFPDMRHEITELSREAESVKAKVVVTGTHTGKMLGINPGGKHVRYSLESSFRVRDGKISECRVRAEDVAELARQIQGQSSNAARSDGARPLWNRLKDLFSDTGSGRPS